MNLVLNKDLRIKIAEMVKRAKEGHIPSSYSIVDLLDFLYGQILNIDPLNIDDIDRDYFILSKGHGCAALYAVLHKYNFIKDEDLLNYSKKNGILGGHPDMTKVQSVEASTGSLGHGFPTAVGTALGLKIKNRKNHVFVLVGDGECHEGTIWESANVARNLKLNNLSLIVDWNGSAQQLMPVDDLENKFRAFGWNIISINGHLEEDIKLGFEKIHNFENDSPSVILAKTIKGYGVSFTEGHGPWHHKIPSDDEMIHIVRELT